MSRLILAAFALISLLTGCPGEKPERKTHSADAAASDPVAEGPDPVEEETSQSSATDAVVDAARDAAREAGGAVVDAGSLASAEASVDAGKFSGGDAGRGDAGAEAGNSVEAGHDASNDAGSPNSGAGDAAADTGTQPSVDAGGAVRPAYAAGWGDQPCTETSTKPGCKDDGLALCICRGLEAQGGNALCCSKRWDYLCVDGVASVPECKFSTNKCCEAHPADGCENPTIQQCVCAEVQRMKQVEIAAGRNPASVHDCCTQGWNGFCTILADSVCAANCPAL